MKIPFRKRMKIMSRAMRMELREHKSSFVVYMVLRALVILTMILQFFNKNYENVFLCGLTLLLLIVPSFIQVRMKIELPTALEITILVFIFAAEILGEIQSYYIRVPVWDTVLHTINGFLMAAIGFALVDILNRSKKVTFQLSPLFVSIVAFCFSMTIGVIWEFFEFGVDRVLKKDMQKDTWINEISTVSFDTGSGSGVTTISPIEKVSINDGEVVLNGYLDIGLYDTMEDLFVTFVGAISFNLFAAIYNKKHKGFIFYLLIDTEEHKKRMEEQYHEKESYHD